MWGWINVLTLRNENMTKILLVEDDKAIVSNLTEFLNNEGYLVKSVSGQSAAMNLLAEEKMDLILLDISLAEGNGFATCKAIKAEYDIPSSSLPHPVTSTAPLQDLTLVLTIIYQNPSVRENLHLVLKTSSD